MIKKKYKFEPYEVILSEWYRINRQIAHALKGVAIYVFVLVISYPFIKSNYLIIGSAFIVGAIWIYLMWKYCRISNIKNKRYREIENLITPELEHIAREWYGNDWHKALVECIEAHYPGDCPLCGAV